jgi:hypothetical protein
MKTKKRFSITAMALFAIITLALASCSNGSTGGSKPADTTPVKRNYTLTLFGKTITVTDTRTGASDKSLEEMGIYKKLQDAVTLITNNTSMEPALRAAFDRVLAKGMIIIVEKPATPYTTNFKAKADGKTMSFDIDYIGNSTATANSLAARISDAVDNYLDKNLEYAQAPTPTRIAKATQTQRSI